MMEQHTPVFEEADQNGDGILNQEEWENYNIAAT